MAINLEEFAKIVPSICSRETSSTPDRWNPEIPVHGHCAVVTLLANQLFGGKIIRGDLKGTEFDYMGSHYFNELADGIRDFTADQFEGRYPKMLLEERTRATLLEPNERNAGTIRRFKEIAFNYSKHISENNPLFDNLIYKACFGASLFSGCKKLRFGAVTMDDGFVNASTNTPNPLRLEQCEPECIRNNIPSRTESMIGACDHAEEMALADIIRTGFFPKDFDIYVAGFKPDLTALIKQEAEFTCIRCATQLDRYGIRGIFVPVKDHWGRVDSKDAVRQADLYALGKKKV